MTRVATFPTWFDRFAADVFGPAFAPAAAARGPRTSARSTADGLELRVELPGFAEDDVEITVEGRVLTIAAARGEGDERVTTGRKVSVGDGYDLDAVTAQYRHGLLTVTVPVAKPASRKVAISAAPAPAAAEVTEAVTA